MKTEMPGFHLVSIKHRLDVQVRREKVPRAPYYSYEYLSTLGKLNKNIYSVSTTVAIALVLKHFHRMYLNVFNHES